MTRVQSIAELQRCVWCGVRIRDGMACGAVSAKLNHPVDSKVGIIKVSLPACGRIITFVVAPEDSPAKKDGWDGGFVVCSDECGTDLSLALRNEGIGVGHGSSSRLVVGGKAAWAVRSADKRRTSTVRDEKDVAAQDQ